MKRYALRDDQWERIKNLLLGALFVLQDVLLKIIDLLKRFSTDIERVFGDWKNVHRRWSRWSTNGIFGKVFKYLAADADNEYGMIDSTIVRAHPHSAGAIKKNEGENPSHREKQRRIKHQN
jgi:transposase